MKLTKLQAKKKRKYYIIYKITNKLNGLCYIGLHKCHFGRENDGYNGSGTKIKKAISLYGTASFTKTILHRVSTIKEANYLEIKEIKRYDSTNPKKGYNIAKGGGASATFKYIPTYGFVKKRRKR